MEMEMEMKIRYEASNLYCTLSPPFFFPFTRKIGSLNSISYIRSLISITFFSFFSLWSRSIEALSGETKRNERWGGNGVIE